MNALIRTLNGFYCSTVFAYFDKGKKSSVIAFDESNSRLVIVNCNYLSKGIRRDVLFVDERQDNWVKHGKWQGLDFIVNNKKLLHNIKKGLDVFPDILDKCKALQTTETFSGWNKLDTADDIEKLMNISLGFHDGYIKNIEREGNDICVKFVCWSCIIIVKFIDLIEFNCGEGITWGNNCIISAKMCFDGGKIRWFVDGFCFEECDNQRCYFVSENAQYKVELCNSF